MQVFLFFPFLLSALISFAKPVQAQTVAPSAHAQNVIGIHDNCGYCSTHGYIAKTCTISADGEVEFVDHHLADPEKKWNAQLNPKQIAELLKLIEATKRDPLVGRVQTYSGDASTFLITAKAQDGSERYLEYYGHGRQLSESENARTLARRASRYCGMAGRRLLWKQFFSRAKAEE